MTNLDRAAMTEPSDPTQSPETQALVDAVDAVLAPLARLAVARGLLFSVVEERLKVAYVTAARDAQPSGLPHRQVSRISTATGINRREVTRLANTATSESSQKPSLALRMFYRWSTAPQFLQADGVPMALPRQGVAPSFESLAALVTRDVHPRSMLEEMLRLKVARWDKSSDTISLSAGAFVPNDDDVQLLSFLAANVGDHLRAFVENMAGAQPKHFEQSIRGSGMSVEAMHAMRPMVEKHWNVLIRAMVPELQRCIDEEAVTGHDGPGEVRIGMYMYSHKRTDEEQGPTESDPNEND